MDDQATRQYTEMLRPPDQARQYTELLRSLAAATEFFLTLNTLGIPETGPRAEHGDPCGDGPIR